MGDCVQLSTCPLESLHADEQHEHSDRDECPAERYDYRRREELDEPQTTGRERQRRANVGEQRTLVRELGAGDGEAIDQ